MFRLRKVYICDCCGHIALPALSVSSAYRILPDGWEHITRKDLCPKCAHKFHIYESICDEKKITKTENGIFIPTSEYESYDDIVNDQIILRRRHD